MSDDKVEIVTKPHTDLWQNTYYHFRNDNAPVFQMETEEKFFSFTVKTSFAESHHRFDQCGIVMYVDSENCPKHIPIPQYIKLYNEISRYPGDDWKIIPTYNQLTLSGGKASECIGCRACEKHCPQKLAISEHMKAIAQRFE